MSDTTAESTESTENTESTEPTAQEATDMELASTFANVIGSIEMGIMLGIVKKGLIGFVVKLADGTIDRGSIWQAEQGAEIGSEAGAADDSEAGEDDTQIMIIL